MLPAVAQDPSTPCAMAGPDGYAFFTGTQAFAPSWRNEVTLRSAEMARENEPGIHIARVGPTPLMIIVAEADLLTATDLALEAYQRALPPKELVMVPGGHFDPYLAGFARTSRLPVVRDAPRLARAGRLSPWPGSRHSPAGMSRPK